MKPSKLIPFIIILAILGGLIYARTSKDEPQTIVTQSQLQKLVPDDLTADAVDRIELYAAGKDAEKVVVRKVGEDWKTGDGFDAPADAEKVDAYVKTLLGLQGELRARDVSEEGLKDYQLGEDEAFRVQAFKADATDPAMDILVGKAPNQNTVFLRQAGASEVFVEATNPRSEAGLSSPEMSDSPTTKHWMNLSILDIEADTITKVDLNTPDKALTFEKHEIPAPTVEPPAEAGAEAQPTPAPTYEWKLAAGGISPAFKQAGLDKILNRMKSMAASNIVDPSKKAEYGLEPPTFTLTLAVEGDEKPLRIHVGRSASSEDAYLHLPDAEEDVVYNVVKYNFEQLFPKGSDLFDLAGITLEKEAITEVLITQPEGNIALRKDGEDWTVTEPDLGLEAQNPTITSLVNTISAWKPGDYVDVAVDSWGATRMLTVKTADASHVLHIGPESPSGLGTYARLDDGQQTLLLSDTDRSKLFIAPRDVVQLSVFNFDETLVNEVNATIEGASYKATRTADGWAVTVNGETVADKNDATLDLVSTLVEFQVADIASIGTSKEWPAYLDVQVLMSDGAQHRLNAGAAATGGIHSVAIDDKAAVFTANSASVGTVVAAIQALVPVSEVEAVAAEETPEAPVEAQE